MVEVVEMNHLDRTVHVAIGNAHKSRSDTFSCQLNGVSIRSSSAGRAAHLDRNLALFGRFLQSLQHARIDIRATEQYRTVAQSDIAQLLLVVAGCVRGVRDIDGDTHGWMDSVTARRRAAQPDLFLHRRN